MTTYTTKARTTPEVVRALWFPHMRGEQSTAEAVAGNVTGSSPPRRGALQFFGQCTLRPIPVDRMMSA